MTNDKRELKPCPVCHDNNLESYGIGGNKYRPPMDVMVKCKNKDCMIYDHPFSISKWNTRATPTADNLAACLEEYLLPKPKKYYQLSINGQKEYMRNRKERAEQALSQFRGEAGDGNNKRT